MGEVNVIIDGKSYAIGCDPGQEQRVQQLGRYVDQRLAQIANGSGATNKAQLMVLTALLLADEVFELKDNLAHAANTNRELQAEQPQQPPAQIVEQIVYEGLDPEEEAEIAGAISKLAAKVENLSRRVQKA